MTGSRRFKNWIDTGRTDVTNGLYFHPTVGYHLPSTQIFSDLLEDDDYR